MARAQVSVEFLIILSVMLLVLFVFLSITHEESVVVGKTKIRTEAINAVNDLGAAAEEVYSQGAGAKKRIMITIPNGYEMNESFVGSKSIKLRTAGSDFSRTVDFEVYGSLPRSSGKHEVWVKSEGNRVRIGYAMIALDRETLNVVMGRNDTRSASFRVINTWNYTLTVNMVKDWEHSDVDFSLSESLFALGKNEENGIDVDFVSGEESLGFYSGYLNITADDGRGSTESVLLPVSVEVALSKTKEGPALIVIPSLFDATASSNSTVYRAFQVCTNTLTSLESVDFLPSGGTPGSWVGDYEPLPAMGPGVCLIKSLSVHVPDNAYSGNYSGFVFLQGNGAEDAVDSIALSIQVGGAVDDTQPPRITELEVFPSHRKIFVLDPVSVMVTANDLGKGDNPIKGCWVSIDNSSPYQMISRDGHFDEPVETAGYTFYAGFDVGSHDASVECRDVKNNSVTANASFSVFKEFLFITENSVPSAEEQAWMDWIDTGFSNEGFLWSLETADSASFMSGSADTGYYAVLVAERFVPGMETRISSFESSGGSVILLGHALEQGPKALGLTVQSGDVNVSEYTTDVVGSHYITSGYFGTTIIKNESTVNGRFWKDLTGTLLARSLVGSPPHYHILGVSGNYYLWGLTTPASLNPNGLTISSRLFDHAVNASVN